ncbi:hypothetical protein K493DRAFT_93482 [Basidiobolus meristosporus CBS 931.73]|uniref:Uncharacterized protein n=1 Tax=Basidiobolus meristosporus CBS 931.73 TaxID=1314790 RepID=A0A1Y1X7T0_9FUNG|nr:hypothetical protein K493DRAFT_93482 [Basidiobolus meristosporus CBS 931.73]|eukprot:ORX81812.1 hypothetical protein K493DRAFT_93482 [Basidiobolus meristosporus CBS 931.73]
MATFDESNNSISELLNSTVASLIENSSISSSNDSPTLSTNLADPVASQPMTKGALLDKNGRKASKNLQSTEAGDAEEKRARKPENESEKMKPFPKMKRSVKYSVDQLLVLSKSPLVKCPDTFPDVTTWIGDTYYESGYRESEAERKKPFNTSDDRKTDKHCEETSNKPGEKSIVLGPPKMSFASSQKQAMVNAKSSERSASSRNSKNSYNLPRHLANGRNGRNDDNRGEHNSKRSSNSNVERERNYSKERENGTNRKGSRETREEFEKNSSRENQGGRNRNNQGSGQSRRTGGKDGNLQDRNRHFQQLLEKKLDIGGEHQRYNSKQDTPEWMNYDPETEKGGKQDGHSYSTVDETGYVDEIQAWKSKLNEQNTKKSQPNLDLSSNEPQYQPNPKAAQVESWGGMKPRVDMTQQNTMNTATNTMFEDGNSRREPAQGNIDYLFGPGGLNFKDEKKSMEPLLNNRDMPTIPVSATRESIPVNNEGDTAQGSSRFFRLFQKENMAEERFSEPSKLQESAMLSRILMGSQASQAHTNLAPTSVLTSTAQTKKMLSEADVLKTLGVTASTSKHTGQPPRAQPLGSGSHAPGRMLTEEDIFKQLGAKPPQSQHQSQFRPNPGQQQSHSNMTSEADILKSLGVNAPSKHQAPQDNTEDKTGFNMIMARLNKNKATNDSMDNNENKSIELANPKQLPGPSALGDPSIVSTKKPEPLAAENKPTPKSIAALFGGNIPTSVYRQLSGKNEPNNGAYSPVQKPISPYAPSSPNPPGQYQPQTTRSNYPAQVMGNSGSGMEPISASAPMASHQSQSSGVSYEESPNRTRLSSPNNMNINQTPLYRSDHPSPYNLGGGGGGTQRPPVFFDQLLNQHHPMLQQQHLLRQQSLHPDQFVPNLQQNSYLIPPGSSPYASRDQFGREQALPGNMGGFPMRPPPYLNGQPPHPYDPARRPVQNSMSGRMMTVEEIERLSMR